MRIVDGLPELPKLPEIEETEKKKQSDQSGQLLTGYQPGQNRKSLQAWNRAGNLETEPAAD